MALLDDAMVHAAAEGLMTYYVNYFLNVVYLNLSFLIFVGFKCNWKCRET